jgi:hypothetical protein
MDQRRHIGGASADSLIRFLVAGHIGVLIVEIDLTRIGPVSRMFPFGSDLARSAPPRVAARRAAQTTAAEKTDRSRMESDDVGRLSRRLGEVEVNEERGAFDGILLGVLPESHEFELKPPGDDAVTIRGSISHDLASKYTADTDFKERLLLRPVRAQIRVTRTTRKGRLLHEERLLEALEPAPGQTEADEPSIQTR